MAPLWAAARAAWPELHAGGPGIPLEQFAVYLARHVPGGAVPEGEHAVDLYLACACAAGDRRALEVFERLLATAVARGIARVDSSPSFHDVVAQDLRTRLLMGDPPKITDYAGRASLASWLKTAAVRSALNTRRAKADRPHDPLHAGLVAATAPERDLLREQYRAHFEEALRLALTELPERERTLLSLSVRDRLSIDALAEKFGVGRSTTARWLVAARDLLTRETRRILMERLGLTPSEVDSVAAEVRSDVDMSIVRLLDDR